MPTTMYSANFRGFCGMGWTVEEPTEDRQDVRQSVADMLRRLRREGYPISKTRKGDWEIGEPEGCCMVPDSCGILSLDEEEHWDPLCRECDSECVSDGRNGWECQECAAMEQEEEEEEESDY